jgi:hypothetical protein
LGSLRTFAPGNADLPIGTVAEIGAHPVLAYFLVRPRPKRACGGDFPLWANSMMGGKRATPRRSGVAMPLGRCGARVASQQSPILRSGKAQNALVFCCQQALVKWPAGPRAHRFPTAQDRVRGKGHPLLARLATMLLAQSGKSQGFGDRVPKSHRSTLKPDEPKLALFFHGLSRVPFLTTPCLHSTCPSFCPSANWVCLARNPCSQWCGQVFRSMGVPPVPRNTLTGPPPTTDGNWLRLAQWAETGTAE